MNIFINLKIQNFVRTFRFIINGSEATEEQQQTLSCILRLDPVDDTVDSSQADDCDCYTQDECVNAVNQASTNYRYDPSYDAVLVISQLAGRLHLRRAGIVTLDGQLKTIKK